MDQTLYQQLEEKLGERIETGAEIARSRHEYDSEQEWQDELDLVHQDVLELEARLNDTTVLFNVLICGSRDWTNGSAIKNELKEFVDTVAGGFAKQVRVITGGARGADELGHAAAVALGCQTKVMPADWATWGKSAGFRRNLEMLNELRQGEDFVLAFSRGSNGTQHTIDNARQRGIPVRVIGREKS